MSFATKPTLARQMIARTLAAGVPAGWVSADEVYGADPQLRDELERRGLGYVLAVARDHRVPTVAGPTRADMLTLQLPARAWQPLSAGRARSVNGDSYRSATLAVRSLLAPR